MPPKTYGTVFAPLNFAKVVSSVGKQDFQALVVLHEVSLRKAPVFKKFSEIGRFFGLLCLGANAESLPPAHVGASDGN